MKYRAIVTSHNNPTLSGVAKFNNILALRMGIPKITLQELGQQKLGPVLLSVKMKDIIESEFADVQSGIQHLWEARIVYDLFLHAFDGIEVEYDLVRNARLVYSSDREIYRKVQGLCPSTIPTWCPALLGKDKAVADAELNIFSFGMAHKIQVQFYRILRDFLEKHEVDYTLNISTAFHEKANFGDFNWITQQLSDIFLNHIRFMGFLSDSAVNYFLQKSQLFVAFFDKGVRSNNTSIYAAMERGCAVLTNCDEYSPEWMRHGSNILDIHYLTIDDLDPENLRRIGEQGKRAARKYADWQKLVDLLGSSPKKSGQTAPPQYLSARAESANDSFQGRIVPRKEIASLVRVRKAEGKQIVLTSGCFDILHVGHIRFLQAAKQFGDILVLCLNTDASIRRVKGTGRPIMTQQDRAELVLALGLVDYLVFMPEDNATEIIKELQPHIYVKGEEYRGRNAETWPEAAVVEGYGGMIKYVDLYKSRSTTSVIEKIERHAQQKKRVQKNP